MPPYIVIVPAALGLLFPMFVQAAQEKVAAAVSAQPAIATQASPWPATGPGGAETVTQTLLRQAIAQQADQAKEAARANQALKDQVESVRSSVWDKVVTAGIAIVSSIVGAAGAYFVQQQRLKFDRQAARQAAGIKELSELKQFRGRQLNEFYAPLEALLRQGLVVRNELYTRLLSTNDPEVRFCQIPDPQAANGWSLGIEPQGVPARPFRLLDDLPLLQKTFPTLMGTVGETVRINTLVVKLIHDKVGHVLHESVELSQQLGTFLAHQSVLEDMYKTVKKGGAAAVPKYTTTFPRELQRLVAADCEKLRKELGQWEAEVSGWVQQMSLSVGTTP